MKTLLFLIALFVAGIALAAPVKFADEGQAFTTITDTSVTYCAGLNDRCSAPRLFPASVSATCDNSTFGDMAPGVVKGCYAEIVAVAAAPAQYCWPAAADVVAGKYKILAVPESVSSYYTYLGVWKSSCTQQSEAQFYNADELSAVVLNAWRFTSNDAINEWVRSQPVRAFTPSEISFMHSAKGAYATRAEVKPSTSTATSAPVYRLNADGTRNTTAVSGVRAPRGTLCEIAKRIGTTSYYNVPSLGEVYAVCSIVSPLG